MNFVTEFLFLARKHQSSEGRSTMNEITCPLFENIYYELSTPWDYSERRNMTWVKIYLHDIREFNWQILPDMGTLETNNGTSVDVIVVLLDDGNAFLVHRSSTNDTIGELKEKALELVWNKENPNGRKLKAWQNGSWRQHYEKDLSNAQREVEDGMAILLSFKYDLERGVWSSSKVVDHVRLVYVVDRKHSTKIKDGQQWYCKGKHVTHDIPHATGGRNGFKRVIVTPFLEKVDPVAEIARLENLIATGHP